MIDPFGCGCGVAAEDVPKTYVVCTESTQVFKAIETQNWDSAIAILKQNPAEAKKWVEKKGLVGGIGSWKRLPIHEACIHKPNEALITALLEANPTGARERDTDGQLPLHHAVENGASVAVLEQLLFSCPDALDVKNKWGNYPEDVANSSTSQDVMNVLKKRPSVHAVEAYKKVRTLEEDKMKDEFSKQLQDERLHGINAVKEARADELRKSQILINEVNEKLSEVAAERDAAHEKISKLKGVLTATESAVTNLKSTNSQICVEKKAADEKVIELNGTVAKLEEDVDTWKHAVTEARAEELKKSDVAINQVMQKYLKATAEKDVANKKISELNATLSDAEDAIKKLKEANSKIYAEKKAVEDDIVSLNITVEELEARHEKLWVDRRKINEKNSSLEKKVEALTLERERLENENKEYKSKVDKMFVMFKG